MRWLLIVAAVSVVLSACSADGEIEVSSIQEAFVYDVPVNPDDPYARQLGLSVYSCNGDYEVEVVDDTSGLLAVTVLNHADEVDNDCVDSFTVHLDSPPHGKTVVDATTGNPVAVVVQPAP